MNLSSGISNITYAMNGAAQINKSAYIWPEYNAGKVARIPSIRDNNENNFTYIKRSSFNPMENNPEFITQVNTSYTSKGNLISTSSNYTPGSIFEALV